MISSTGFSVFFNRFFVFILFWNHFFDGPIAEEAIHSGEYMTFDFQQEKGQEEMSVAMSQNQPSMDYGRLKDLRVLLVEDEDLMRENMSMILKRRVKDVATAQNGRTGIERFQEFQPDLIITDLAMPEMDGSEMINELRKSGYRGCIIVVSAYNEDLHSCSGADARLLKPIMTRELFHAMNECILSNGP